MKYRDGRLMGGDPLLAPPYTDPPEPGPYIECLVCGRRVTPTLDEDEAYCKRHSHLVPHADEQQQRRAA